MRYRVCVRTLVNGIEEKSSAGFFDNLSDAKLEAMTRFMMLHPFGVTTYVVDVYDTSFKEIWTLKKLYD